MIVNNKIIYILLSLIYKNVENAQAFHFPVRNYGAIQHVQNVQQTHSEVNSSTELYAKPPTFDLSAIEDYEAELELQKKLQESQSGKDDNEDDDDEVFAEADCKDMNIYEVPPNLHNKRIDAILFELDPSVSRSQYGTLISNGMVAICLPTGDGDEGSSLKPTAVSRKSLKLEQGTTVHVKNLVEERPSEIIAQDLPLNIIFEDEHMVVLNKAAGMVVHPAVGNWDGTVVNALAYYLANKSPFGSGDFIEGDSEKNQSDIDIDGTDGEAIFFRPGIVHRLDKGTTGLLVVAKTREALSALSEAFAARKVKKTYVAVTIGNPGKRVVIDKPIGRHPTQRQRMRVVPDPSKMNSSGMTPRQRMSMGLTNGKSAAQVGRNALSFIDTLAFDGKLSVAQVRIETGRTHQIRVHLQDRTTPIFGDDTYGFADWNKRLAKSHRIQRPLLHAFRLELEHPITGKRMVFRAPMAEDMATVATGIWPEGSTERSDLFHETEVEIIE
jgi:23S rRNA pseudouridine1911/1915/1917 synthase